MFTKETLCPFQHEIQNQQLPFGDMQKTLESHLKKKKKRKKEKKRKYVV